MKLAYKLTLKQDYLIDLSSFLEELHGDVTIDILRIHKDNFGTVFGRRVYTQEYVEKYPMLNREGPWNEIGVPLWKGEECWVMIKEKDITFKEVVTIEGIDSDFSIKIQKI